MPHMQQERRLAPAPLDESSLLQKPLSTIDKSEDQYLPRFGFRTYPERVHQHAREERDRRLGKKSIKKPLIDLDDTERKHRCDCACLRLSDREWFATHPLARSRLRDVLPGEDDIAAGQVLVTLKGKRTIEKTSVGGGIT
jgi:hypothetical protein